MGVRSGPHSALGDENLDEGAGGAKNDLPLAGLRVIAVEEYAVGPFATMILADLGVEVVKIENPRQGGDSSRHVPPFQRGTDSLYFESIN